MLTHDATHLAQHYALSATTRPSCVCMEGVHRWDYVDYIGWRMQELNLPVHPHSSVINKPSHSPFLYISLMSALHQSINRQHKHLLTSHKYKALLFGKDQTWLSLEANQGNWFDRVAAARLVSRQQGSQSIMGLSVTNVHY